MPLDHRDFLPDPCNSLKDESGVVVRLEMGRKLQVLWAIATDKLDAGDKHSANKEIDDFISTNKLEGEFRQRAMLVKRRMTHNVKISDVALMEEIVAIDPNSPTGKRAADSRRHCQCGEMAQKTSTRLNADLRRG